MFGQQKPIRSWYNHVRSMLNPLSANPEKWSNTLKQIVGNLPTICLSVFDHFMNLTLKGLKFRYYCYNFKLFVLNVLFLYPLKTSENLMVSDILKVYKCNIGNKWAKPYDF